MTATGLMTNNQDIEKALGQPITKGQRRSAPPMMLISRNIARKYLSDGGLTPLDVLIGNLRYWATSADALVPKIRDMISNLDPNDETDKPLIGECIKLLKTFEHARDKAQECAVDAAPYMHPRYQQIAFKDDEATLAENVLKFTLSIAGNDGGGRLVPEE